MPVATLATDFSHTLFESEISTEHQEFLQSHQINVVWYAADGFVGTSDALTSLRGMEIL